MDSDLKRDPFCVLHDVCPHFDPESVMCQCLSGASFCGHELEVLRARLKLLDDTGRKGGPR